MKSRNRPLSFFIIALLLAISQQTKAISLNVGETYTCDIGSIPYLKGCQWTITDNDAMEFVNTPGTYDTRVTVRALSSPTYASPVIVHCKYYYLELDPVSGRYIYQRSGYKDFNFFIHDPGPTGIEVNPSYLSLDVGERRWLTATVYPSSANQTVSWNTDDRNVATVNGSGYVEATGSGETYITVSTVNGKTARCFVSVKPVLPTSIKVSPGNAEVAIGETRTLSYSLTPDNAYGWWCLACHLDVRINDDG